MLAVVGAIQIGVGIFLHIKIKELKRNKNETLYKNQIMINTEKEVSIYRERIIKLGCPKHTIHQACISYADGLRNGEYMYNQLKNAFDDLLSESINFSPESQIAKKFNKKTFINYWKTKAGLLK